MVYQDKNQVDNTYEVRACMLACLLVESKHLAA